LTHKKADCLNKLSTGYQLVHFYLKLSVQQQASSLSKLIASGVFLQNSQRIQVGDRILILTPSYVAGKYGIVRGRDANSDDQANPRWLIQVEDADSSDIVVSLVLGEFTVVQPE
jgi:hypothetical protein